MIISFVNLDFDKYESFGISQDYIGFEYTLTDGSLAEIDEFESSLNSKGLKLFSVETAQEDNGLFCAKMIVGKSRIIFSSGN